jgi:hypothetical protein
VRKADITADLVSRLVAGVPGCGFPWPWTVYRWIDGTPVTDRTVPDLAPFAADLAGSPVVNEVNLDIHHVRAR